MLQTLVLLILLGILSITKREMLKSLSFIADSCIFPFSSISFCSVKLFIISLIHRTIDLFSWLVYNHC